MTKQNKKRIQENITFRQFYDEKIANLISFKYPSYQEGLKKVISEIKK